MKGPEGMITKEMVPGENVQTENSQKIDFAHFLLEPGDEMRKGMMISKRMMRMRRRRE